MELTPQPAQNQQDMSDNHLVLCKAARSILSLVLIPPSLAFAPRTSPAPNLLSPKANRTMQHELFPQSLNSPRKVVDSDPDNLRNSETLVNVQDSGDSFQIAGSQSQSELPNPFLQFSAPDECTAPRLPLDGDCTVNCYSSAIALTCDGEIPTADVNITEQLRKNKALPLGSLLSAEKSQNERIAAYLVQQEAHEANPHIRQDIRQAQICVLLADRGNPQPFVDSSYTCHGTHPKNVWRKILANRRERLDREYKDWYDAAGNPKPDVPKKVAARSNVIEIPKKEAL